MTAEEYVRQFLPYSIDDKTEREAREMVEQAMSEARKEALREVIALTDSFDSNCACHLVKVELRKLAQEKQ